MRKFIVLIIIVVINYGCSFTPSKDIDYSTGISLEQRCSWYRTSLTLLEIGLDVQRGELPNPSQELKRQTLRSAIEYICTPRPNELIE